MDIQRHCDAAFNRVRDAFDENFRHRHDIGASVAVTVNGRLVVDLWAGLAIRTTQSPWSRNTIVDVYSASKGLTSI